MHSESERYALPSIEVFHRLHEAKVAAADILRRGDVDEFNSLMAHLLGGHFRISLCLSGEVFEDLDLTGVIFISADLSSVQFLHCVLNKARFDRALLHRARFETCQLTETDFREADMLLAEIEHSDLAGACNLTEAQYLRLASRSGIIKPQTW